MTDAIEPFRLAVPESDLDDLRRRLAATRWPEREPVADRSQGAPLERVRALCAYWQDGYGRDAEDLNAWMVARGYAIAYWRYAEDYVGQEAETRAARRGIWAGTFQEPSDWRKAEQFVGEDTRPTAKSPAAGGCGIKGNISAKGERIYHTLNSPSYARTRIDKGAGERMFCSEDEARTAGWRGPRG